MTKHLQFADRAAFREWLGNNCATADGVWLLFGKGSGPKTVTADEALEEAPCFGWIDGQMRRVDDQAYIKYFSRRRPNSKWSDKNKALAEKLERQGLMNDHGRAKMEEARKNGQWDAPKPAVDAGEQIALLTEILREYEPAYSNYLAMSPSVQKTYARGYFDAKTDVGRAGRLSWMVERLNQNLKPM